MTDERVKSQVEEFFSDGPKPEEAGEWEIEEEINEDPFTIPEAPAADEGETVAAPAERRDPVAPVGEQGELFEPEVSKAPPVVETPSAPSELETLKEQNRLLMAKLEELISKPAVATPPASTPGQAPPVAMTSPGQVMDFVGDEDLDEILSDKEKFNALMSKAVQMAITNSGETFLKSLPSIVQTQVATQTTLRSQVDAFYNENTDLQPVKKVVGSVANEVAALHPDWELGQIFEETAKKVREMLGLKKGEVPVTSAVNPPSQKPALPGAQRGGNRTGGAPLTALQKQIIDIL